MLKFTHWNRVVKTIRFTLYFFICVYIALYNRTPIATLVHTVCNMFVIEYFLRRKAKVTYFSVHVLVSCFIFGTVINSFIDRDLFGWFFNDDTVGLFLYSIKKIDGIFIYTCILFFSYSYVIGFEAQYRYIIYLTLFSSGLFLLFDFYIIEETTNEYLPISIVKIIYCLSCICIYFLSKKTFFRIKYELLLLCLFLIELSTVFSYLTVVKMTVYYSLSFISVIIVMVLYLSENTLEKILFYKFTPYLLVLFLGILFLNEYENYPYKVSSHFFLLYGFIVFGKKIYTRKTLIPL